MKMMQAVAALKGRSSTVLKKRHRGVQTEGSSAGHRLNIYTKSRLGTRSMIRLRRCCCG